MGGGDGTPVLPVIAHREEVLERLSNEPAKKCDLVSELDTSRSTVDRAITELEGLGLIARTGHTYRTTLAGELASEEFDRFASRVRRVADARELLESLPADARLDPVLFEDCDLVRSEATESGALSDRLERRRRHTERLRLFARGYRPSLFEAYCAAIEDGAAVDVAVTEPVLDRLLADHRTTISEGVETGRIDLRVATETFPYNLSLLGTDDGTAVTIEVYDDEQFVGLVSTDDAAAAEWGRAKFEEIWDETTPLFLGND